LAAQKAQDGSEKAKKSPKITVHGSKAGPARLYEAKKSDFSGASG
jgi:hypothetical protein